MTQDMNHTYMKALRAVIVVAMMSLTGSHALAGVKVTGNVYGGGNMADVGQSVTVNISSGEVQGDVYGGGALANTNTANWDASANDGAGGWATGKYNETTHTTTYTTSVNLTGGLIKGDAYGGGLGQKTGFNGAESDKAAVVYGDIAVTLNGTAFEITKYTDEGYTDVVKSGRVFGCNNLLGSPKGNVTVTVYKTVSLDADGNVKNKPTKNNTIYELAAVYGGGNLAPYTTTDKKTHVIIHGCSDTSIETVYGGGNAAAVPETQVDVYSAYEIRALFGGGNGKDKFKNDEGWQTNPGADINGDTNTMIYGGTVHEAYGGSNEKGTITGNVAIDVAGTNPDDCPLVVDKLVGAGKNADVNGDLIMILGCKPSNKIDLLYAGADNANVKGNVELTITSGNFGKVFGGNNAGGAIFGHIKLNIEETGDCGTPITIDELYLGGNEAAYSVYGYYEDGTIEGTDKPKYVVRTSLTDGTAVTFEGKPHTNPGEQGYANPELNVISATYIGKVYGGGFGTGAKLYGNPIVNINMIQGNHYNDNTYGVPAKMAELDLPSADNPNNLGVIGDVYGGGNAADVVGDPTVNIGTETTVTLTSIEDDLNTTEVNESQKTVLGAYIIGNVFGGGMGDDDSFFCDKAMIGKDGDGVDNPDGGPTVNIYKGTVRGNVYGGGEIGRVEKNTVVTIGAGDGTANGTPSPVIMGSVFGGGKGKETHGYAALVRGNPTVTIQGNASVGHSVYGGGEIASVARYKVPKTEDDVTAAHAAGYTDAVLGMPYALADPDHPSGICTVIVQGYAKIGPDGMQMTKTGGPDDTGYVFGAGRGILPGGTYKYQSGSTRRMVLYDDKVHTNVGQTGSKWQWVDPDHSETNKNVWEYFDDLDEYIRFIQTLALSSYTHVTIDGNALVKGSVYGGSENGIVQFDTDVKIQGGQIGVAASGSAECASWTYEAPYAPYDPYAIYLYNGKYYYDEDHTQYAEGGASVATDGHTYYGNVFGGGSGSVPYFDSTLGQSVYLHSAGQVKGDTYVTISGGHILTNVYGGCEATNVSGTAYVTMTAGTIGVERTDAQIIAHPLTGYIFGAGKGDQRIFFNKDTNVENTVVTVEGGTIYGSVYGGGEDGHVMKNVTMTIGKDTDHGPTIGTRGTSYYDGNVFGGGRGFGGEALTAGNVGGTVTLNIEGGTMLGSVYGGGRLASVGYGLYLTTETGFGENQNDGYGVMQEDGYSDWTKGTNNEYTRTAISGFKRGYITVNVKGGTIGNDVADAEYGGNVFGASMGSLKKQDGTTDNDLWNLLATAKETRVNVTGGIIKRSVYGGGELGTVTTDAIVTVSGGTIGTSGNGGVEFGNVYGGGKGYVDPAGSNYITAGIIKGNTTVTINPSTTIEGEPSIYHNIYGGGAYGSVGTFTYDANNVITAHTANTGTANVTITGGTIGINGHENGMVFGSSRGDVGAPGEIHDRLAWVYDTHVTIGNTSGGPEIRGSIYGSGENGHTYHDTEVIIHKGMIGMTTTPDADLNDNMSTDYDGANYPYRGNVYGGGCGTDTYTYIEDEGTADEKRYQRYNHLAGIVRGQTKVLIDGGQVVHNIYGGGAMGSVGKIANYDDLDDTTKGYKHVASTTDGKTFFDFGLSWPYEFTYDASENENVGKTSVTITGSAVIGVEGSTGGHVFGAARGAVDVGTNDITEQRYIEAKLANVKETYVTIGEANGTATTPTIHGSVYGGGEDGHVYDDASVTIHHGTIAHSVFGGGKGEGTFETTLWNPQSEGNLKDSPENVHSWTAGKVYGNTYVTMNGGSVGYSIYGGGNMASVGKGNYAGGTDDYSTDGYGELPPSSAQTLWDNTNFTGSGIATVTINAGTVGSASTTNQGLPTGNVFGSSRGKAAMSVGQLSPRYRYVPDFFLGYVNKTVITIGGETPSNEADAEPIIHGSVYGGGQDGHVRNSTHVIINKGSIGSANGGTDRGNVFGAGSGLGQYTKGSDSYYNNSSGSVTCTTQVDINGGKIFQNVYGGGALSSVGPPFTGQAIGIETNAATDSKSSYSYTQVNINGGTIGTENSDYGGNVYGASRGSITINYQGEDPNTYATDLWSTVNIGETSSSVPTVIWGNVFGGGENGQVKGSVTVTMTGGEVKNDVYGGGALAHTNTSNWVYNRQTASTPGSWGDTWAENMTTTVNGKIATKYNTLVSLTGGRIYGDAYGGALGQEKSSINANPDDAIPAYVYGDVTVKLNEGVTDQTATTTKGCIVHRIFGCNNLKGTPKGHVQVYVYATQKEGENSISDKTDTYDMAAVYGGGNLAPYEPADAFLNYSTNKTRVDAARSEVYIDGCDWTSIQQVYGGGNAAAAPATFVQVNRCYEIDEVFGGGNGFDSYSIMYGNNEVWYENPGANVGYKNYTHFYDSGKGSGTQADPYVPVENTDADTKEKRMNNPTYRYGSGIATTEIRGGKIHTVYGGSNKKGNISTTALSMYAGMFSDCPMDVDQSYGGGKDADIDGEVIMQLNCAKGIKEMFGGSKNADVDNDISLTVTNGSSLERVFGGNNTSGAINGSITVNIEEGGCEPVIINELYLGGYLAPYSVYGYQQTNGVYDYIDKTDEEGNAIQERIPLTSGDNPKKDPRINVISATRIDNIYGGGYKAKVVGNPHINVNMKPGRVNVDPVEESGTVVYKDINDNTYSGDNLISVEENGKTKYYGILPLGSVGNIYGGGNEADIVGNTYVEIGTGMWLNGDDVWETEDANGLKYTYKKDASNEWHWYNASDAVVTAPTPARKAAVMRSDTRNEVVYEGGNVYGGGNKGDVTGNTYVNICAYEEDVASTTDVIEYKGVTLSGTGNEIVTIAGNVFGGGKGVTEAAEVTGAFECAKGMVGVVNTNNGSIDITKEVTSDGTSKGTRVSIGNGTINGNVYGGGEVGRVEWNGVVTIGLPIGEDETSAPEIKGNVFGGGKGVEQYGYAALLRGNTFVTVQANAKVGLSVYGGGEIASVGKYWVNKNPLDAGAPTPPPGLPLGMPYSLANQGSGYCNVIVRGNAEIGPDNMKMYYAGDKAPDDEGHVFGAGKGVLPYENNFDECPLHPGEHHPGRMNIGDEWECFANADDPEAAYLRFIETQALATQTEVLVDGNAFVKGSVYGGSLSGHVQHNTHVTIAGGQIGNGDGINERYTTYYNVTEWPTDTKDITVSWAECAHWPYDTNNDMPYDPYAKYYNEDDGKYYYGTDFDDPENDSKGGSYKATDGHTYYGNVFGGGSGVVPYGAGKWHREAGTVGGNTVVDITGGHILTSVYGGNEHTDVGTYDNTNYRNLLANTGKCTINMIGGTVGVPRKKEDIAAHPVTCYVFGAGKGDQRVSFNKWTNVGETEVNITKNARIYGSTFGGGEDGHVLGDVVTNIGGTVKIGNTNHFYPTNIDTDNPGVIIGTQGLSGADGNIFGGGRGFSEKALTAGVVCGNVTVNIYKGTMLGSVFGGGRLASVGAHLAAEGTANYGKLIPDGKNQVIGSDDVDAIGATHGHIAINIDGGTIGATSNGQLVTSDYSIGDVFGGCKGSGNNKHFGLAKHTVINMTGGTVNGNVYGGGELGYVGEAIYNDETKVYSWAEAEEDDDDAIAGLCTVGISGGTVKGNVFGAGKGLADDFDCEKALVRTTSVAISGTSTSVGGNVYGGGEIGRVDQDTEVTIGSGDGTANGTAAPTITGSVFGAGAGVETHGYSALVRGNATVTVQGNANVGHNVYGGGMIASVGQYGLDSNFMPETLKAGGDCRVTVKGYAVIGASGEGHVFGAGMGVDPFDDNHSYIDYTTDSTDKETKPKRMTKRPAEDKMPTLWDPVGDGSQYIWEYYTSQEKYFNFLRTLALATDSYATVEGNASVHGSVYGGSESGFVQRETDVKIQGSSKIETTTDTNGKAINGNVFGGGRGVSGFDMAGRVRGNAKTTISGSSTVNGNVYGGGELGFVGKFTVSANGRNYDWQKITKQDGNEEETGTCTVLVNSASAEVKGDVFGAGKGEAITFKCEPAMTRTTSVSVNAGTVDGNVYGGGEVGRVDENTVVTIGAATGESAPDIKGSVFGAGAGLGTHGYSALVRGNTYVTVQNHAAVGHSVYGGGEIASVGKYGLDDQKMPSVLLGGGYCYVKVKGDATISGDVFGAGQGITPAFDKDNSDRSKRSRRMTMYSSTDFPSSAMISAETGTASGTTTQGTKWEYYESGSPYVWEYFQEESDYLTYLETLALATHPEVTIEGNASIGNDVYGGGERGITKGSVIVNINGGTIARDVYGGGALANTNTTSTVGNEDYNTGVITTTTVAPTTTVNLHGGTIGHNVYGGGLGQKYKAAVLAADAQGTEDQEGYVPAVEAQAEVPAIAALVYGDVLVKLNENTTDDNCVVKGVIHGANNYNGSPQGDVTVHVYKTQGWEGHTVDKSDPDATRTNTVYELKAVYGGGNEATYDPVESADEKHKAHVIIDGCDLTSIETVYGGGNAASAPETYVEVNSCYEIGTVFGGGNGKDKLGDGSDNPGAHVGYKADGTTPYGTGVALAELKGGTIHKAFGGSNTLGNVRTSATVTLNEPEGNTCPLCIEEVYGAGNEAAQDGTSNINLGCLSYLKEIYGGAKNADIDNDIELTIQSGRFDRVFGGNNLGGDIKGTITVNIEETGCHPIIIGQLFGGGNKAGYSVEKINKNRVDLDFTNEAANNYYKNFPKVNVKSFTSIGEIYGGGYGAAAVIVGNPHVIINECVGDNADVDITKDYEDEQGNTIQISEWTGRWFNIDTGDNDTHTVWQPEHKAGAIGTIGNVFGGGNQAGVNGNTNVIIGTESTVLFKTPATKTVTETVDGNKVTTVVATTDAERTHTVVGANITGNVYGGGNAADVSGDTNVLIGK